MMKVTYEIDVREFGTIKVLTTPGDNVIMDLTDIDFDAEMDIALTPVEASDLAKALTR